MLLKYYQRIHSQAAKLSDLGAPAVLHWVSSRDEEESAICVGQCRNSEKHVGTIVKEVFDRRESVWFIYEAATQSQCAKQEHLPRGPAG